MKNIELDLYDKQGNASGKYEFANDISSIPVRKDLYNDVVRYQLLKRRQGTADTKTRKEVRGGGAKPYRQKGTGRARAGTRRSPLWVGGGIIFGPHPRDYSIKLPKKVRRIAVRSAIAEKISTNALKIIDSISFEKPSTKEFVKILNNLGINEKTLVILTDDEYRDGKANAVKSMRNIPFIDILSCNGLNLYSVLNCRTVLITKSAMENIEKEILQ